MPSINKIIYAIALIMVGFLVAAVGFSWRFIEFDAEVNLLSALELVVTVGVLFYLQNILSSRGVVDRVEKDLIIERLRWVTQKLLFFSEFCQREVITPSSLDVRSSIVSEIRSVEAALLEVSALLEATPIKAEKEKFKELVRGIMKIRASLIGGSFPRLNLDHKTNRLVSLQISARLRDLHKYIVHVNRL